MLRVSLPGLFSTDLLRVRVQSDVDGTPGGHSAQAEALVDNVALTLTGAGLSADAIGSSVNVSGVYGALSGFGGTTLANAIFNGTVLGASPAPNTSLINALGLSVLLNEQIFGGDGIGSRSLLVNAVHISFTDFVSAGAGVLNGDIIISHSEASLTATADASGIPEPATSLLLGAGIAGLALTSRRGRSPKA